MRTVQHIVYTFDELSDEAKEHARQWWRKGMEYDSDHVIEDAVEVGKILGIEFDTYPVHLCGAAVRHAAAVFSVSSSQGDGASFKGRYAYRKGAAREIRDFTGRDKELARIADELQAIQRRHFYKLTARMRRGPGSNFYAHSGTMSVDVEHDDDHWRDLGDDEEAVRDLMRAFADWIYDRLREEYDYQTSGEAIDEVIQINEYEFNLDGSRA